MKKFLLSCFLSILALVSLHTVSAQSCCFWLENEQPSRDENLYKLEPAVMNATHYYTVHFNNTCALDLNTPISLDWEILDVTTGTPVAVDGRLSEFADVAFQIYVAGSSEDRWVGSNFRTGMGRTSTDDPRPSDFPGALLNDAAQNLGGQNAYFSLTPENQYDFLLLHFLMHASENDLLRLKITWKQVGHYKIVIKLNQRTGGSVFENFYLPTENQNIYYGGHSSTFLREIGRFTLEEMHYGTNQLTACSGEPIVTGRPPITFVKNPVIPDPNVDTTFEVMYKTTTCYGVYTDSIVNTRFIVSPRPSAPQADSVAICGVGVANLVATSTLSSTYNITFKWYANATDETPLHEGATYSPNLTKEDTVYYFYVRAFNEGCASDPVKVAARVNKKPAVVINNDLVFCPQVANRPVTAVPSNSYGSMSYVWTGAIGTSADATVATTADCNATYNFSVVATDNYSGCTATAASSFVQKDEVAPVVSPLYAKHVVYATTTTCDSTLLPAPYASVAAMRTAGFTVSDNCSEDGELDITLVNTENISASHCTGKYVREYKITDHCNNETIFFDTLTIVDNIQPQFTTATASYTANFAAGCKLVVPAGLEQRVKNDLLPTDNCTESDDITIAISKAAGAEVVANEQLTVTITDICGNINTTKITMLEPEPLAVTATVDNDELCLGGTFNFATTVTGGTAPYTYNWTGESLSADNTANTSATPNYSDYYNTKSFTYTVKVTDNFGCEEESNVIVTVNGLPHFELNAPNAVCYDADAVVTANNLTTDTYTYNVNGTDKTGNSWTFDNLTADVTYTVVATNTTTNCTRTENVTVLVNDEITYDVTPHDTICDGASITIGVSNPADTYTYEWYQGWTPVLWSGKTTPTIDLTLWNGRAGYANGHHYNVDVIQDQNGITCKKRSYIRINVAPSPEFTIADVNVCEGGDATLTPTINTDLYSRIPNEINNFAYLWSNGETTPSITVVANDTVDYRLTITNRFGCTYSRPVKVTSLPNPTIATQPSDVAKCTGSSFTFNVVVASNTADAVTYQWQVSDDNGTTWNTISGATAADYTETLYASGNAVTKLFRVLVTYRYGTVECSTLSAAAVATINPSYTATINGVDEACENTEITLTADAPAGAPALTYTWQYLNGTTWTDLASVTNYTLTATTDFRVLAEDPTTQCTSTSAVKTVVANPTPTITLTSTPKTSCNDSQNGSITITDYNAANTYTMNGNTLTSATIPNLVDGTYTITIEDAKGCTNSASVDVQLDVVRPTARLLLNGEDRDHAFCYRDSVVPAKVECPNHTLFTGHSIKFNFIVPAFVESPGTDRVIVKKEGTYKIGGYVLDETTGCSSDTMWHNIYAVGYPEFTIESEPFCMGSEATLSVVPEEPTYTYAWFEVDTFARTATATITPTNVATKYKVKVSAPYALGTLGAFACSTIDSITVTANPLPVFDVTGSEEFQYCNSNQTGKILVDPSDDTYTYYLEHNGVRTLAVKNGDTLAVPHKGDFVVVAVNPTTNCEAKSASVFIDSVKAGFDVKLLIEGTDADYYFCKGDADESLATNVLYTKPSNMICDYSLVNYSLSAPSNQEVVVSAPGKYKLGAYVTNTTSNCVSDTVYHYIHAIPTPVVNVVDQTICFGESATLSADATNKVDTMTTNYTWSNGATTKDITINPTTTTDYTVTVDYVLNGTTCSNTATGTVAVIALPTISLATTEFTCPGSTVELDVTLTNTTNPPYTLSDGSKSVTYGGTEKFEVTSPGVNPVENVDVTITATDNNGCTTSEDFTVTFKDETAPVITGALASQDINGCDATAVPAAYTTVAQLEANGLTIEDNCTADAALVVTSSDASEVVGCGFKVTRTYTVTDKCSNFATATQIFNVKDETVPVLIGTWPSDIEDVNACYSTSLVNMLKTNADIKALYRDACSEITVTSTTNYELTSDCNWKIVRTYTIKDACNNTVTKTMSVSGANTTPPTITATNTTIECGAGYTAALTAWTNTFTAVDACGTSIAATSITSDASTAVSNTCGIYNVVVTATDACANTAAITVTCEVKDTQKPVITTTTLADRTIELGTSCGAYDSTATSAELATIVTDNCTSGLSVVRAIADSVKQNIYGADSLIIRTWTSTKDCGNNVADNYVQKITIVDNHKPVFETLEPKSFCHDGTTTLADFAAQITTEDTNYVVSKITDNCADATFLRKNLSVSTTIEPNPNPAEPDKITRTWKVMDNYRNEETATQIVWIYKLPIVTISGDNTICKDATTDLTVNVANYTTGLNYAWDNNATTATISSIPAGTYNVTVTTAQGCVNTATIEVTEHVVPSITLGLPNSICPDATLTVNAEATENYNGNWSVELTRGITENLTQNGTNTLNVTSSNTTTTDDSVKVEVTYTYTDNNCTVSEEGRVLVGAYPELIIKQGSSWATATANNELTTSNNTNVKFYLAVGPENPACPPDNDLRLAIDYQMYFNGQPIDTLSNYLTQPNPSVTFSTQTGMYATPSTPGYVTYTNLSANSNYPICDQHQFVSENIDWFRYQYLAGREVMIQINGFAVAGEYDIDFQLVTHGTHGTSHTGVNDGCQVGGDNFYQGNYTSTTLSENTMSIVVNGTSALMPVSFKPFTSLNNHKVDVNMDNLDAKVSSMVVYPNPASVNHILNVNLKDVEQGSTVVRILTLNGKVIDQFDVNINSDDYTFQRQLDNVAPGMYFIQCVTNGNVLSKKVIIQNR